MPRSQKHRRKVTPKASKGRYSKRNQVASLRLRKTSAHEKYKVTGYAASHVREVAPDYGLSANSIIEGDALTELKKLPSNCVDLIFTSPPYADRRKGTYGGIPPEKYVEWLMPIGAGLLRVLKPTGSFVLNIKEKAENGERHTYVIELILALRNQGWLWTEEYIWHKRNCYPGKWPNRFRDAWERLLHFTKSRHFAMYQDTVRVPMGNWRHARLRKLSETDKIRDTSKVGSGFGKNISNWIGRELAYPTNVLHLATECANRKHSAAFPEELPSWFIKLFTKQGDLVLDPFIGSGTTAIAAAKLGRDYIGIEIKPEYCELARDSIRKKVGETLWNHTQPKSEKSYAHQPSAA